jgi:putative iron-dependent peroxidase
VGGEADGLVGGSFAAIQQWQHDLKRFHAMPSHETDDIMGRRLSDNEELDDAPISAHVKRTAQESFAPEAFVVRRSMPWIEDDRAGLMFLAFGFSLDAFEVQLRRMSGLEDGITDGLYRISRPITGGYYWCPPLKDGRLDLRALRIGA